MSNQSLLLHIVAVLETEGFNDVDGHSYQVRTYSRNSIDNLINKINKEISGERKN